MLFAATANLHSDEKALQPILNIFASSIQISILIKPHNLLEENFGYLNNPCLSEENTRMWI